MRAAVFERYGGADAVEITEIPMPRPGRRELLVRVICASVNPVDWKVLKGEQRWFTGRRFPRLLGSDFSGIVSAVGSGAKGIKPGTRVFGLANPLIGGAFAEYVRVPESSCAVLPDSVSFAAAAAMPAAGISAIRCFRGSAKLKVGSTVLVNGCTGGVGSFAVQIARTNGAKVTGVCSTRNLDLAKAVGCHEAIDYTKRDVLGSLEKGRRFHVIVDVAGTLDKKRARRHLHKGGTLVVVNVPNKKIIPTVLRGLLPGVRIRIFLATPSRRDLALLANWAENEMITAVIDSLTPLAELRSALTQSIAGRTRGKLVVAVADESPV